MKHFNLEMVKSRIKEAKVTYTLPDKWKMLAVNQGTVIPVTLSDGRPLTKADFVEPLNILLGLSLTGLNPQVRINFYCEEHLSPGIAWIDEGHIFFVLLFQTHIEGEKAYKPWMYVEEFDLNLLHDYVSKVNIASSSIIFATSETFNGVMDTIMRDDG